MEWGLPSRTSVLERMSMLWLVSLLISAGKVEMSHSTISASPPHLFYTCPEGATVKLVCNQRGAPLHNDSLKHAWLFTSHSDQHCTGGKGPRNFTHSHNTRLPEGMAFGHSDKDFFVLLKNVSQADQGRYCCLLLDVKMHHNTIMQRAHSHVILHVTPRRSGSPNCTVWDPNPPAGSVPVALALTACILALLSLPLILVLVYKQRQSAQSNKRAQELVRMDSDALGHENPVFLGESPQPTTRTVSQIMARQSSETGRHLLSEPGTPLSPPAHGDVFFPAEDTIPESPDFMQV
ncbi:V-type immunoglobulin domain-containing suppressor of T-cell activation [Mugil cephalus]|uniref:V-type immunoglobulin domain-containing suppressor of T-cell activation n=1 Tax=Mugil cephalus TaxID=48193 RepID=UPI001FB5DE5C|nr:V-type immunoglobulin domain-containing suppressor of T-cell activation [Mugil cephalus]